MRGPDDRIVGLRKYVQSWSVPDQKRDLLICRWHQLCVNGRAHPRNDLMRIEVIRKPTLAEVDGIALDVFEPGLQYEVGTSLGALFLAEGWGQPVASDEPAVVIPISKLAGDFPTNAIRDRCPGLNRPANALDRRRRARHRPS
jgi:hypothetical protein